MNAPRQADLPTQVAPLIARYAEVPGGLLPLLHAVQDLLGHVPDAVVPLIARGLNLSRADVHGVITYYHEFRTTPPAPHVLQLCQAEACQACGSQALMDQARMQLGCDAQGVSADGQVQVAPVYCLGLCASAPSMRLDGKLRARVTQGGLERLLAVLDPQEVAR
jgi:formate dehydrogenase subunit gamma